MGTGDSRNQTEPFQSQQAANTYLSVIELFNDEGSYVSRVSQGADALVTKLKESLAQGDVTSSAFQALGKEITIPTIRPRRGYAARYGKEGRAT